MTRLDLALWLAAALAFAGRVQADSTSTTDSAGAASDDVSAELDPGVPRDEVSQVARHGPLAVFAAVEQARLDTDCRGYLVHLEQVGILSPTQRELVIDRLMALEGDEIDIDKLKWVVLMVLFSQPGQETAFSRMEDLVFEDRSGAIH